MDIKSSGSFREFASGAIRDDGNGEKGRMDLVPVGGVGAILCDSILINLDIYMRTGDRSCIIDAINEFISSPLAVFTNSLIEYLVSKNLESISLGTRSTFHPFPVCTILLIHR